jgi:hypothetical protein
MVGGSAPLDVDLFKRRVGSGQGRVVGHLARHVPDLCLVLGWVGLAHASLFDVSGRVFWGWVGFFGSRWGFRSKSWLVPGP